MASTLLAVDDSVTMRKVLEITFAGQDFRVVTVSSPDAALQKLKSEKPDLVIADGTLEPNGYELCKAIKKASPATPVLLLSSKQNAFDAAKAGAAQVDDHMDKPFDTQQMIDKVKKLLTGQASTATLAPATAGAKPAPAATPQRAKTLIYNPPPAGGGAAPPGAAPAGGAARPAPSPLAQTRVGGLDSPFAAAREPAPAAAPKEAAAAPAAAPAAASPVAAQVNGQMSGKLEGMGLTPAQVEAVLALSREVLEKVVWEVVPTLAEVMIKEEIARLTK